MENSISDSTPIEKAESTSQAEPSQTTSTKNGDVEVNISTPNFKNAATPHTAITGSIKAGVGSGTNKIRFFGPRFFAIWVMPMALTGILMEFLFISPLRNINPFS